MCATVTNSSLTERLVHRCTAPVESTSKQCASILLLDWLGCVVAGQDTDAGKSLRRFAKHHCSAGVAFNATGKSLKALDAAFINGGLGNILEVDDLHRQSILHTGDTIMPAALAVAQEVSSEMDQLLEAIVKGYEVAIQIGLLASSGGYSNWYNSSTCGVFGAGMAACSLLGLNREQTLDALGQCGMMASGLWQCRLEPCDSKQLATAHAARSGVMAAMLAADRFPGPKGILDGELGFFKTLYPSVDLNAAVFDHEQRWKINEVSVKPWPACRHTHPVIEAALNLATEVDTDSIVSIEIGSYRSGLDFCNNPTPASDHEARFSLQYCVASALLRGSPELDHFSAAARSDSAIVQLIRKTHVVEDDNLQNAFPGLFGGRVAITLANGECQSQVVRSALGDPENPLGMDALRLKFEKLSQAAGLGKPVISRLINCLTDFEQQATLLSLNNELDDITQQLEEHRYDPE